MHRAWTPIQTITKLFAHRAEPVRHRNSSRDGQPGRPPDAGHDARQARDVRQRLPARRPGQIRAAHQHAERRHHGVRAAEEHDRSDRLRSDDRRRLQDAGERGRQLFRAGEQGEDVRSTEGLHITCSSFH